MVSLTSFNFLSCTNCFSFIHFDIFSTLSNFFYCFPKIFEYCFAFSYTSILMTGHKSSRVWLERVIPLIWCLNTFFGKIGNIQYYINIFFCLKHHWFVGIKERLAREIAIIFYMCLETVFIFEAVCNFIAYNTNWTYLSNQSVVFCLLLVKILTNKSISCWFIKCIECSSLFVLYDVYFQDDHGSSHLLVLCSPCNVCLFPIPSFDR